MSPGVGDVTRQQQARRPPSRRHDADINGEAPMPWDECLFFFFPDAVLQSDMAAERVVKTEEGEKLAKVKCDGSMC